MAEPKEGVDFELVLMKNQPKGGTNKTRRFLLRRKNKLKINLLQRLNLLQNPLKRLLLNLWLKRSL